MKVVILCGGKGTRLREETEFRPKPMVPIGGKPILWHIMKTYSHYGYKDFILCLGYKGEVIKEYFRNYLWNVCDTTVRLGRAGQIEFHNGHDEEDWTVTLANTGQESGTASRLKQVQRYLLGETDFLFTYGDGVGDVDISEVVGLHQRSGKIATLTAVHPPGRFGQLSLRGDATISSFNEKPQTTAGYINGGFMVLSQRIFSYLPDDPTIMLEQQPMQMLAEDAELQAYLHHGFWQPMDTFQEYTMLNQMWSKGTAPWKVWKDAGAMPHAATQPVRIAS